MKESIKLLQAEVRTMQKQLDAIKKKLNMELALAKEIEPEREISEEVINAINTDGNITKTAMVKAIMKTTGYKRDDITAVIDKMVGYKVISQRRGSTSPNAICFNII